MSSRNVRWPRRMLPPGNVTVSMPKRQTDRQTDEQTDGRTPKRYITLFAIDAASVTIVIVLPRVADCRSVRLNEMCLIDGNCSEEPGICHENSSCSLVSPERCV